MTVVECKVFGGLVLCLWWTAEYTEDRTGSVVECRIYGGLVQMTKFICYSFIFNPPESGAFSRDFTINVPCSAGRLPGLCICKYENSAVHRLRTAGSFK